MSEGGRGCEIRERMSSVLIKKQGRMEDRRTDILQIDVPGEDLPRFARLSAEICFCYQRCVFLREHHSVVPGLSSTC